mmetsp:Transcript_8803/g.32452  ORF Transcript_8803/g.32452 Transcript_8803/m.32452 type:complete len:381 (-) Transcript_8803:1879-3021(-)|eukprot:scaffold7382_cov406-Prasinococcus_capsulatus_cf.AAC.19
MAWRVAGNQLARAAQLSGTKPFSALLSLSASSPMTSWASSPVKGGTLVVAPLCRAASAAMASEHLQLRFVSARAFSSAAPRAAPATPSNTNSSASSSATEAKWEDDPDAKTPALHPGLKRTNMGASYLLMHPVYSSEELDVEIHHRPVSGIRDHVANSLVNAARGLFDYLTGYKSDEPQTEEHYVRRCIFLETVAGVPGMVGGMLRHLHSLRTMKRDHGWIHTLLEEAENERMHLLTFLEIRKPGPFMRLMVLLAQGTFFNLFFLSYLLSPRTCHRFVGYLEEEAVRTYTHILHDIDSGALEAWRLKPAPEIAKNYWQLADDSTMRDVILAIRADEACHSHVNHTFASMRPDETNPFTRHVVAPQGDFTKPPKAVGRAFE